MIKKKETKYIRRRKKRHGTFRLLLFIYTIEYWNGNIILLSYIISIILIIDIISPKSFHIMNSKFNREIEKEREGEIRGEGVGKNNIRIYRIRTRTLPICSSTTSIIIMYSYILINYYCHTSYEHMYFIYVYSYYHIIQILLYHHTNKWRV